MVLKNNDSMLQLGSLPVTTPHATRIVFFLSPTPPVATLSPVTGPSGGRWRSVMHLSRCCQLCLSMVSELDLLGRTAEVDG